MCNRCNVPTIDKQASEAFAEKMVEMLNHAGLAFMASIGHRTGLFDTMAATGPGTSHEIAQRAGLQERYVREWLGAMVTGGIVTYDPEGQTYTLPAEHAAYLTRAATPNNIAATTQWLSVMGSVEDELVECFRRGGGVPYERYGRFPEVMREESNQTTVAGLDDAILPLAPGLTQKLEAGIEVLDIGCGAGAALIHLAERFPNSRFTGYDLLQRNIDLGRAEADRRGLTNLRLEVTDVSKMQDADRFDLITAFDAIHDQARPDLVLAAIARALKPDGLFLMQDITGSSYVQNNLDAPLAPFIYTISTMHCMTVSLAQGGMGLGAAWGREKAVEMLKEAGFRRVKVERLEHDIMNNYYLARLD